VFTVVGSGGQGTGFVADSAGLVLAASSVVGNDSLVQVFLDAGRRVFGRVVASDAASGLAALLVPLRHCPARCLPLDLAADSVLPATGDTVAAMIGPVLTDARRHARGTLTAAPGRLTAAVRLGDHGAGAPVVAPDGSVIGVTRSATASTATLVDARVVRALVERATTDRAARRLVALDSLPPSWPATALSEERINEGVARTTRDLDAYRFRSGGFDVLVMTPQVVRWRRAQADTVRKGAALFEIGVSCPASEEICDPLEQWKPALGDYLAERRGVVIVQVSPEVAPAPGIGVRRNIDFRTGNFQTMSIRADNDVVVPIESARIFAVPNPQAYTQRNRQAFVAGVYVLSPASLLRGRTPRTVELTITDATRPDAPVRITIPASVLQAVATDLADVLR
jgi:hypothetical protein